LAEEEAAEEEAPEAEATELDPEHPGTASVEGPPPDSH